MITRNRRRVFADEEINDQTMPAEGADTSVAPEATDLLFEAEDVAELVAEISGQPVEVTADEDQVTFAVGDDEYTVEADGDEEVLEAVRKPFSGKRPVASSRRISRPARRTVKASRSAQPDKRSAGRTIRKVPSSKR